MKKNLQKNFPHAEPKPKLSRVAHNSRRACNTSLRASTRLALASSSVSPWEMAAGISSIKQVYPPSSAGSKTAVSFIVIVCHFFKASPRVIDAHDSARELRDRRDIQHDHRDGVLWQFNVKGRSGLDSLLVNAHSVGSSEAVEGR